MSSNIVPSIEILPVELLHRIFDSLDAQTILLSIRPVCRLFRSVVSTYNRYVLDLKSISQSNFYVLCRLIHPQNVISITLSNDERTLNQIDLFISLVRLRQFTRLRSLTLLNIDEGQLNFMLKRMNLNLLTLFSSNIRKYDGRRRKTTTNMLSSMISKSSLCKLELNTYGDRISEIAWPMNGTIQYLNINNYINMDNLLTILQCSPHLHTIIMKDIPTEMINNLTSICFRQLTSLTIKELRVSIDEAESFLSLTPSLMYLKLIGGRKMMDGKRWEQFIEINLPQLDQFEFYFNQWKITKHTLTDLETMIASFRTSFWIEHKKWFVTSECTIQLAEYIYLYSIPICKSSIDYRSESENISLSTYPMTKKNDLSIMDNINSLSLTLNKSIADDIQEKKEITNHPLFPKVTEMTITFKDDWPSLSLQSLSMFIDISRIVHMEMCNNYFNGFNQKTWMDIGIFVEQAHNLSSLIIASSFNVNKSGRTIQNIHSIVPRHVKHLQIPITDLDQIKLILERCENLSTIKFNILDTEFLEKIIKWFTDNTINTRCRKGYKMVAFWLGKKKIEPSEISVRHKRIKLTENS